MHPLLVSVELMILKTDYTLAAIVYCFNLQTDGTCQHNKLRIAVWSRGPEKLTDEQLINMKSYMEDIECTRVEHMNPVKHGKIHKV